MSMSVRVSVRMCDNLLAVLEIHAGVLRPMRLKLNDCAHVLVFDYINVCLLSFAAFRFVTACLYFCMYVCLRVCMLLSVCLSVYLSAVYCCPLVCLCVARTQRDAVSICQDLGRLMMSKITVVQSNSSVP